MSLINSGSATTTDSQKMSKLVLEGQPYRMFIDSCRAQKTKETYESSLRTYMLFRNITSVEPLLLEDPKEAQSKIIDFIGAQQQKGLSWQTRVIRTAALKHFYEMNDVTLNWKKINRFIGEKVRTVQDRAYTKDEIRRMLDKCDERKRVMILLLASTGMRLGALHPLKLKHLTKVNESIYRITVYHGTPNQYIAFCTPECASALDSYLEYRKRYGENLSSESPVLREQFDKSDHLRSARARHITQSTISNIIEEVLFDSGLRNRVPQASANAFRERKEVMAIHGFRKFYDTSTTQAGVHPLYVELLLGHDIALKGSYFKPTEHDLLEGNDKMHGYLAAIETLTISGEHRLRLKISELEENQDRISMMRAQLEEQHKKEIASLRAEMLTKFQQFIAKVDPERLS
jgi:integrase